ncbi:MAG: hypothetical protein ABH851_04400 [Methanobacteriota archaeon]
MAEGISWGGKDEDGGTATIIKQRKGRRINWRETGKMILFLADDVIIAG